MDAEPSPFASAPRTRPNGAAVAPARSGALRSIVLLGVIAIVGLGGGIALHLSREHAHAFDTAWRDGNNLAIAFERHADATVSAIDGTLRALRLEYSEGEQHFLHSVRTLRSGPTSRDILQITIIGSDGYLRYSDLRQGAGPVFLGDREHFSVHRSAPEDKLFVSAPVLGKVSGQWSVQFSRRLAKPDGSFAGVIVLSVAPERFSAFLKDVDVGANGSLALWRDGGTIIARASPAAAENFTGQPVHFDPLREAGGKAVAAWRQKSPLDGVNRLVSYRHLKDYPLAVIVGLAENDVLAGYRQHRDFLIRTGLVVSLGIVVFALWLVRAERQRERVRRAARESESRFRRLFAKAPLAYQSLDSHGRIIDVNEAWEKLFGYSNDEAEGRPFSDFVAASSRPAFAANFAKPGKPARIDGLEIGIVHKDGTSRLVSVSGRSSADGDDHRRQLHCILHDITRARQQEDALKASEARLRGIVENINVATWELDLATWQFTYVSPQVESMFGYPAADWLQPGFWPDHLHPDDRDAAVDLCVACTRRLEDHNFEYRFLKQDGSIVWVRDLIKVIADETRTAVRLTGVMIDITAEKNTAAKLANQQALLRSLIDSVPDLIFFKDRNSVYLGCNRAFCEFTGRAESEQIGKTDFDFFDHDTAEFFRATDRDMLESGDSRREEEWVSYPDGRRVLLDTLKAPFVGPRGEPLGLIGISRDITARKRDEETLRLAHSVFETTTEGIVVTDADGRIVSVNPAFTAITGWRAAEAIGKKPNIFKSGRHPPTFYAGIWTALRDTGHWEGEIWNRRKNGELVVDWMTINAIADAGGETAKYVALFSDITQRKRQEQEIWRQANFDALTGLANRNLFHDRLERALARARRNPQQVGLMFIDLDRFKWVNDTLGHEAGDRLLIEAAARLRTCVREEDTVARLGGDEFTIVLQGLADHEPLQVVADKVLAALALPFDLDGTLQYISGSIGITIFPTDGDSSTTLLRNADIAMYQAKEAGKNRYQFYSPNMQADALARVQIEQDLRQAIAAGGFVLHYQPIIDADSSELLGAEALLRWQHPARGLLAPADFLPVAEETGLILPIGEWVIDAACRQWRSWADEGHAPLRLAINVSTVHFRHAGLHACLAGALSRHGVPGTMLSLEITEALMIGHGEATAERLRELKALDLHFSLDDFGTGYSSLSTLKRFPFDTVKIDSSFVADCVDNLDDAHLIEAIVFMAHSLNLQVVAEGVETEQQLDFLRDLGCDYVQGYLVSRPLPAAAFRQLIERRILLPDPQHTAEECRLLAALRRGSVDPELWVQRLVAERDPALAAQLAADGCRIGDLDLCATIIAHLQWRSRLEAMILDDYSESMSIEEATSATGCALGQWLESQRSAPTSRHASFPQLLDVHRDFHSMAGSILADLRLGRRAEARRRTRGLVFRKSSHAVVTALIDLFIDERVAG